jgi:vitamin B12 transporter
MKFLIAILFINACLNGAEVNISLENRPYSINNQILSENRVEIISDKELEKIPGNSIDEKISVLTSAVNISRLNDIYSYKSVVSLMGMPSNEQGRTLILLDSIALNNSATGGVNWNMLSLEDIDHIEIYKGPSSFVYGSNAMSGVINIVTKKPQSKKQLIASYGSNDTFLISPKVEGKIKNNAISIGGSHFESDGYISNPNPDQYTSKLYLRENSAFGRVYSNTEYGNLDLYFLSYSGIRGEGSRIETAKGVSRQFDNYIYRLLWDFKIGEMSFLLKSSYLKENYLRLNEYFKNSVYYRIDSDVLREDSNMAIDSYGGKDDFSYNFGLGFKGGNLDGSDLQMLPSYSKAIDKGKMNNFYSYLSGKYKINRNLSLISALRYDNFHFYDGLYNNSLYTNNQVSGELKSNYYDNFSPSAQIEIKYNNNISQYLSYSRGFRNPNIEDMSLSLVKNTKFSKANPALKPEKNSSIQSGFSINIKNKLYLDPSIYSSYGSDFIYEIKTQEKALINNKQVDVYMKDNVSDVRISGFELPVKFFIDRFYIYLNSSYSKSKILKFYSNEALEGKELAYAPKINSSLLFSYDFKLLSLSILWKYKSRQYLDDMNTNTIPAYSVFSISTYKKISDNLEIAAKWENIFNKKYLESVDSKAPGSILFISSNIKF